MGLSSLWTLSSCYHADLLSAHVATFLWNDVAVMFVLWLRLACVSCKNLNKTIFPFSLEIRIAYRKNCKLLPFVIYLRFWGGLILCEGVIMDHRGHHQLDSGLHSHRTKDREDYYRRSQQDRDQRNPPPYPRERDRHWAHPDAHFRAHFTSPPARPEQYPYSTQHYPYGHGHLEPQRPQSRCVQQWEFCKNDLWCYPGMISHRFPWSFGLCHSDCN